LQLFHLPIRSLEIYHRLQQLILCFYCLRISLVNTLSGNHVNQLCSKIHVGVLYSTGLKHAQPTAARCAYDGSARSGAFLPQVVAVWLQTLGVGEVGQGNLA